MRAEQLEQFVTNMADLGEENGVTISVSPAELAEGEAVHFVTIESQPPLAPAFVLNALQKYKMLYDMPGATTGRGALLGLEVMMPGSLTFRDHNAS